MEEKETTLKELIHLTKKFIGLADELYSAGKITQEEYDELTYIKKDFLSKANNDDKYTKGTKSTEWKTI